MAAFEGHTGRVIDYASDRGLGTLVSTDASGGDGRIYSFHCTNIADGSREIADGAAVVFRVHAVGPGVWEAVEVQTVGTP